MKHTLFLVLAALSFSAANAQKNSILLYGNINGSIASSESGAASATYSSFGFNLNGGYQVSNHVTLGLIGRYSRTGEERTAPGQSNELHSSQWAAGIFGRYTYYLGERLFVYLDAEALRTHNANKVRGFNVNLYPAVGFFVYRHWAVNLNVGGINYRLARTANATNHNLSYSFGQGLQIGISKNFVRKRKELEIQ